MAAQRRRRRTTSARSRRTTAGGVARTARSRRETARILAVVGLIVAFSAAVVVGGTVLLGQVVAGDPPVVADPGTSPDLPPQIVADTPVDAASVPPITTVSAAFDPLPADVDYVALGDSFAAGLGIAPQRTEPYGPYGGSVSEVSIDGEPVGTDVTLLDERPVATMPVLLDSTEPLTITWLMTSAQGQTGDAEVGVTPGVGPGSLDSVVPSAC